MILRQMRALGFKIDKHFFGTRCDNQAVYWELVRAGCGVGAMQTRIGDVDPKVEKLAVQPQLPALPIWLAAHEALHKMPRVKRVWGFLADYLSISE